MRVLSKNRSGRVARLKLDGRLPTEISGQDLRVVVGRALGWQHVKSTSFELRRQDGTYHFSGHGSGHGVGLCVIGSVGLAARGISAAAILGRYFPGLTISSAEPRLVGAVPESPRIARAPLPVLPSRGAALPAGTTPVV